MNLKKNAVVFTILLFCIFFSISCVVASDVNDTGITAYENQIIDDVNGELIASSSDDVISSGEDDLIASSSDDVISASSKGTFTELQKIINNAKSGATITLDKDYSYDNEFYSTHGIIIAKDLTIDGNGHTLNGLSESRIFFILFGIKENNKVTLNNIVFKNGFTKLYGGAILNFADLTVNKCTFENNYAGTTAGAICSVGSLDCKNSNFNKNTAKGSGGAIFSLNFENEVSYFNNNSMNSAYLADIGNVIEQSGLISKYMDNITKVINQTGLISKYIDGLGNIFVENGLISTFFDNLGHSIEQSSAVSGFFDNMGKTILKSGILSDYTQNNGIVGTIEGIIINAVLNNLGTVVMKSGVISSFFNKLGHDIENNAIAVNNISGFVFSQLINIGSLIETSNVISNYLKGLGSLINEDNLISKLMIDVSIKPATDKISNCKFSNNVALGRGGGAVYAFTHINIDSSTFTSNKADQVGGAVYAAKNLKIKNSKFTKNKASIYGGAVYFKFHDLTGSYDKNGNWKSSVKYYTGSIEKCTFTQNVAKNRGGAIYGFKYSQKPNRLAIKPVKCTFSDNQADAYNELYGGTFKSCTFKNTITLKTVKVKKSAKKLVLAATLKKGKKVLKNKKVTFKFNGKTYNVKTNSKGVAKVTVKSSVLKKLKAGSTIYYQASYAKLHVKKYAKVNK